MHNKYIREVKSFNLSPRVTTQQNSNFAGYASVFNNRDLHNDIILPGSIGEIIPSDVPLIYEHNPSIEIGEILFIKEDGHGLFIEGTISDQEILKKVKNAKEYGLSIGFVSVEQYKDNLTNIRYIGKINLYEISVVENPANPKAILSL